MKKVLPNALATKELGVVLARSLPPGTVILLEGDLGAGKTTLVQGIGEGLGIKESIDSPTFTLINEYLEGRIPLYHLDLYRLEPAEVAALHLDSYWEGIETPLGLVAIEWAEKLREIPGQYLRISLNYQEDDTRQIEIIGRGQNLPRELDQI
jgi:tRNA threonylcarbamoyladenosine biosynthesis protein TsaE